MGPTRKTKSETRSRADARFRFTAYALDYAAAVRGSPDALTHDPRMIEAWGLELRRRWDALDPARQDAILASLRSYAAVEVAQGASEDVAEAIRFLVGDEF